MPYTITLHAYMFIVTKDVYIYSHENYTKQNGKEQLRRLYKYIYIYVCIMIMVFQKEEQETLCWLNKYTIGTMIGIKCARGSELYIYVVCAVEFREPFNFS